MTMYYSQNLEDKIIEEYFGDFRGTLLDVGANDGQTFSNSLRLIELGWSAHLFEPSPTAFGKLCVKHVGNESVSLYPFAVGDKRGTITLHESGAHVRNGNDVALVSSIIPSETQKWRNSGVQFTPTEVEVVDGAWIDEHLPGCFDFITIDAEGMDVAILKQLPLSNTRLVCIEWNGVDSVRREIVEYCAGYGLLRLIHENNENLIIGR